MHKLQEKRKTERESEEERKRKRGNERKSLYAYLSRGYRDLLLLKLDGSIKKMFSST